MGNFLQKAPRAGTGFLCVCMLVCMLAASADDALAQSGKKRISGTVLTPGGDAIVGAMVTIQNTTVGTTTNADGLYVLDVNPDDVLRFSYIGFLAQDVAVRDRTVLDVVLETDVQMVEQVVVVGYGAQKRAQLVSAVTSVSGTELGAPTANLTGNLSGRLAGLIAVQRSTEPGRDDAEFWIRGVSSYAGGTSPLILVDGVPRAMGDIEADEIETFNVLKDAAATAVYGAEGANGVVLITTKRGTISRPKIAFRAEYSLAQPQRVPEFVDSWTYFELANEALYNDAMAPYTPPAGAGMSYDEIYEKYRSGSDPDLFPNSKWMEEMMSNVVQSQRYTLNFRGGAENAKYFVSMAFLNQDGVFKSNPFSVYDSDFGYQRYNLRSNIDLKVSRFTTMTVDLSGQLTDKTGTRRTTDEIYEYMLYTPPHLFPTVYSDGTIAGYAVNGDGNNRNPFNLLYNEGYKKEWNAKLQTNVTVNQDLGFVTPGLNAYGKVAFDYDGSMAKQRRYDPFTYNARQRDENGDLIYNKTTGDGTGGFTSQTFDPERVGELPSLRKIYIEGQVRYQRTYGRHDVSAMMVYTQKEEQAIDINMPAQDLIPVRKQGVVGRATYSFGNRYFLEASFGYTGSYQFARGHRWGLFPAVGVSYYLSNEAFYPEALRKVMNGVKLRVSVGRTGNDRTGGNKFMWRSTYALNSGYNWNQGFTGQPANGIGDGVRDERPANPDLGWEVEDKRNIGLDLAFWNSAVELTVDYFNNRRSNILVQRATVPNIIGLHAQPWANYGIQDNYGIDGSVRFSKSLGDWRLSAMGNFTFARNRIVRTDDVPYEYDYQSREGHAHGAQFPYIAERLYTEDDFIKTPADNGNGYRYTLKPGLPEVTLAGSSMMGPGDIKYADYNNDGTIDTFDRVRGIAYPNDPEINYGFGLNAEWKGIYVSVFFQGVANSTIQLSQTGGQQGTDFQSYNAVSPFSWGVEKSNFRTMFLDRWTEDNPSQNVLMPRLHTSHGNNVSKEQSTWWLVSGNFLRFKNLEIGYTLPERITEKMRLDDLRVYVMGQNLHLWDELGWWDPEGGQSNAGMRWPRSRTFTIGVDFNF